MAQTLREALNAKSVSLTHSESLELIAKILGCRDWNSLAAKIQSSSGQTGSAAASPSAGNIADQPARQKIVLAAATLDDCVGFYQFSDNAVYTVARDADHLLTRLTGQRDVPFDAQSPTEFFSDDVHAQITFVRGERGPATSVILHQGGTSYPMQRIDAAAAQQITSRTEEKVKSQSASPGTEAALRRLIEGIISGEPNYDEMNSLLAEATRRQLPNLQSGLVELGAVRSVAFLGVGAQAEDVYSVRHENGASHWRIALDSKGAISTAWVTPGP
jgi:glyoxalase superfamily protein